MTQHSLEATEALGHAYFNAFNERTLDVFDDILAPEFVSHLRIGDVSGIEAFKTLMESIFDSFPEMEWVKHEMIVAEDRIVYRYHFEGVQRGPFLGIPTSNKFIRMEGAEFVHVSDGRITEIWNYTDLMGLAARLNAVNPLALEM